MKNLAVILSCLFVVSNTSAAFICDNLPATGLDSAVVEKFRTELIAALKEGSARKVASMVSYPITVTIPGKRKPKKLLNVAQMEISYDKIFTADFVAKIVTAPVTDTVCRDQGVGLASGAVWLHAPNLDKLSDVKLIAINR